MPDINERVEKAAESIIDSIVNPQVNNINTEDTQDEQNETEADQTETETETEETEAEETEEEEDDDEAEPEKPQSRAQKRIRQLNSEKNELAQQVAKQDAKINELVGYMQQLVDIIPKEQPKKQELAFETQQEFYDHVYSKVKEDVLKQLAPVQQATLSQTYKENINTWFSKNPDALGVKDNMDKITEKWSDSVKKTVQGQILSGDTSMLDLIYAATKSAKVAPAAPKTTEGTTVATGKKSIKGADQKTVEDRKEQLKRAVKSGDFRSVVSEFIPENLL